MELYGTASLLLNTRFCQLFATEVVVTILGRFAFFEKRKSHPTTIKNHVIRVIQETAFHGGGASCMAVFAAFHLPIWRQPSAACTTMG